MKYPNKPQNVMVNNHKSINFSIYNDCIICLYQLCSGHVVYQGKTQDKVLKFDNMARGIYQSTRMVPTKAPGYDKGASGYTKKVYYSNPLTLRPYDITHNRLIK